MIVGQIAPNAAIVSSADTPFPAIGRTIIASMPVSNNRLNMPCDFLAVPRQGQRIADARPSADK